MAFQPLYSRYFLSQGNTCLKLKVSTPVFAGKTKGASADPPETPDQGGHPVLLIPVWLDTSGDRGGGAAHHHHLPQTGHHIMSNEHLIITDNIFATGDHLQ